MILRRVTKHVQDQNWLAVALDFFIVVVGVFVGLQVQEWAVEQERERQEDTYVARLHNEVAELQSVRQPLLDLRESFFVNISSAIPVLYGEIDRPLTKEECDSIAFSATISNPTDDLATLLELQQTGGLTLFRNEDVLSAVRSFLMTRARARDSHDLLVRTVRPLIQDYPMLMRFTPNTDFSNLLSGVAICDLTAMRENNGFINTIHWNSGAYGLHIQNNRRVSESLADLHQALDEFSDKTHQHEAEQ